MKTTKLNYLIIIMMLASPGILMAQTDANEKAATDKTPETATKSVEKQSKPNLKPAKKSNTPDVFIPTEEISEDQPVPFPVDI